MNRSRLALALKFLVSGGLIWVLLGSIDLQAVGDRILAADLVWLSAAVVMFGAQIPVLVWRWRAVMIAMNTTLPFLKLLEIIFIGLFFNQALPSSIGGDAVRIYKTFKSGILLSRAVNGVMLDRFATVLGLVLLVVIATPFFIDRVGEADARWIVPAVSILALGGIAGLATLMLLDTLPPRFSHLRLVRGMAMLAADTRAVFLSPRHAPKVMLISLVGHLNVAFGAYLIALSLGLGVTWIDCMVLMPPVLLLMTIPISIAGWGVREAAMVTAFGLIGISNESAVVLSITFGLLSVLVALPGGLVWLMSDDRKIRKIGLADTET